MSTRERQENLFRNICLLILGLTGSVTPLPESVTIVGLFLTLEDDNMLAFEQSVAKVNADEVLTDSSLVAATSVVPEFERFFTEIEVCRQMSEGVAAIFGPNSPVTAGHIQSVCDSMEMPHVETRWDGQGHKIECSVNLYPAAEALSQAVLAIVRKWKWTRFTVIYEDADSLSRLAPLLRMYDPKGYPVTVRQLTKKDDYRTVFKIIKSSGDRNIVLDCSIDHLETILIQAQQVGIMGYGYNYIITNLDLHTLDLKPFQYAGTNITGIRLVMPEEPLVTEFAADLNALALEKNISRGITPESIRIDTALTYDAVQLLARALERLGNTQEVQIQQLDCAAETSWEQGCSLTNFMRTGEILGLTGVIRFDQAGLRSDIALDIFELREGAGAYSIGNWNSTEGLHLARDELSAGVELKNNASLHNMTFIVLISMTDPYGMLKDSPHRLSGNDRYEGYCVDLIKELAHMLGFNYSFAVQEDNDYGSLNKATNEWSGMIKEILEERADLAITDLTITHDRETAVDFTMPFMNLGIALLFTKPTKMPPSLFSFMSPFSSEVWVYLLLAYALVSVQLFVQSRMAPDEWNNPYPCIEEPEELENQFSINNSFWFSVGAILQQGTEIAPIAVSTRMTAGIWWFFSMIMVSSYTANLAAFLTVEPTSTPIKSVEDLDGQDVIKFGLKQRGSTMNFFKDAVDPLYKRLYITMSKDPSVFTKDNAVGLAKVQKGGYAFFMESTSLEYLAERHCEVTQVGGLLDSKSYGIAMRKNAPYRNALSTGVLKLQETGRLEELKRRWWKQRKGGGACMEDEGGGSATELNLDNVGGVFLVLVVGVAFAFVVGLMELICHNYHKAVKEKISFKEEMIEDIKFISRCHGSTKPVRKPKSEEDILREVLDNFQPVSPYATAIGNHLPVGENGEMARTSEPESTTTRRKNRRYSGKSSATNTRTGSASSSNPRTA